MNVGQLAVRYAKALYEVASEAGEDVVVHDALEHVALNLSQLPEAVATLQSPLVEDSTKLSLLRTAGGGTLPATLERFFNLLVERGREEALVHICQAYKRLYDQEKGIIHVRLMTAHPLDDHRIEAIRKKLEASTGRIIELIPQVNPDLIGGYVLMTDDKRLDASVRTRLLSIQKQLTL